MDCRLVEATDFDSITGGGVRARVDDHEVLIGKADLLDEQGVADVDAGRDASGIASGRRCDGCIRCD